MKLSRAISGACARIPALAESASAAASCAFIPGARPMSALYAPDSRAELRTGGGETSARADRGTYRVGGGPADLRALPGAFRPRRPIAFGSSSRRPGFHCRSGSPRRANFSRLLRRMRDSASNPLRRSASLAALAGFAIFLSCATAQGRDCIPVDRVVLEGAVSLDAEVLEAELSGRTGCLDRAGLNELLELVTLTYTEAGFIAARGYFPEQDLSDGELRIAVVEGVVSGIDLRENGEAAPSRAATAFPGMIGRPLRLRRLEQGLAQIDRLPSSRATSELRPGAEAGETALAVDVRQGRRFRGGASLDDRGSESTGRYNFGLNGAFGDFLGLNDAWTIGLQISSEPSPRAAGIGRPVGRSLSLSGSMPWGMWTFGISGSVSDYATDIAGVLNPVPSEGSSASLRLSVDRVLSSTKSGRWDAGVSLSAKENENLILGARIDTASRRLSVLDAHLSRGRPLLGGQAQARLTLRRGLGAFGAVDDDEAPEGSPKAQYRATLLDLSWARRWDLGGAAMALSLSMRG